MGLRIAHLADIHWRSISRHAEYREAFKFFCEDIEKRNVDKIFIAGDIFHTKTLGISPEFIEQMTWWLKEMSAIAPVHMTLGNHDGNLINLTRQDAITPLVAAINRTNVKLYKRSGIYDFAPGFKLCVFSLFDQPGWVDVKPPKDAISIVTYHGPVWGCQLNADMVSSEGVELSFFDGYDFALLGDIHQRQNLAHRDARGITDETVKQRPWIAYPGSAIQQNYSETQSKGYLLWDIESRDKFDVEFVEIPNNRPYVTIDWQGTVDDTLVVARQFPNQTRFRVKSNVKISQKDTHEIVTTLQQHKNATEVTFSLDKTHETEILSTGVTTLAREDLRSHSVLVKLLREYYDTANVVLEDEEWQAIDECVANSLKSIVIDDEVRNTIWTIRDIKFDNLYSYGLKNEINFDNLGGITGIFGPNRIGKSSIPGAIMYALHNSSDRGKLKNIDIVNVRKQYGYARLILTVAGTDYVLERQTTKRETKKGDVIAYTGLNVYKVVGDGELLDLNGEQRFDTEKIVRSLIGTEEDFCVTSFSAQGEHNNVISMGSARRKLILTKFLDLDIFEKLHEIVKIDVNSTRVLLKNMNKQNWEELIKTTEVSIESRLVDLKNIKEKLVTYRTRVDELKHELAKYVHTNNVTQEQIDEQRKVVKDIETTIENDEKACSTLENEGIECERKIAEHESQMKLIDVVFLRAQKQKHQEMSSTLVSLQHIFERENDALTRKKRSLTVLSEVPCGDAYPTCKFISDAHNDKNTLSRQEELVVSARQAHEMMKKTFDEHDIKKIDEMLDKHDSLSKSLSDLRTQKHDIEVNLVKKNFVITTAKSNLEKARKKLIELESQEINRDNDAVITLKTEISNISSSIESLETNKIDAASDIGKLRERESKLKKECDEYDKISQKNKLYELVSSAFSKSGVPTSIVNSQLPIINAEICKILRGIVDFTIELEVDKQTNDLDIFINYGDSKRIIELCSGMEKMISSIALRVALTSISSLPRSDMLIIDEGFGSLDDGGVTAVNKLLESLRKYYKHILVITHVDGVKDIADNILEITKVENDSRINCT